MRMGKHWENHGIYSLKMTATVCELEAMTIESSWILTWVTMSTSTRGHQWTIINSMWHFESNRLSQGWVKKGWERFAVLGVIRCHQTWHTCQFLQPAQVMGHSMEFHSHHKNVMSDPQVIGSDIRDGSPGAFFWVTRWVWTSKIKKDWYGSFLLLTARNWVETIRHILIKSLWIM